MRDCTEIQQFVVGAVATNCYLVFHKDTKEGFVVDPGGEAERIREAVKKNGVCLRGILLTHGHFDHVDAAKSLQEMYQVPVYAHIQEQKTLEDANVNMSVMMGQPKVYEADEFLKDEQTIEIAGFGIRVLFTPGHTQGGCCYYIPREDILFSGDTLFCGSVGRTDFPGGSMATLVQSIRHKLLVLPERTQVLPGHDARTTIEQERIYNPFL